MSNNNHAQGHHEHTNLPDPVPEEQVSEDLLAGESQLTGTSIEASADIPAQRNQ